VSSGDADGQDAEMSSRDSNGQDAEISSGDADGREVEANTDTDTGNRSTEQLQLSHADVAVLETSGARFPSVDLTESCSTTSPPAQRLKVFDVERIIMGDELSDSEINHAQRLLQARHPRVNGLRLTLYKEKLSSAVNSVQIVHCPARHHWITTTTMNCKVFDSLLTYCDKETMGIIYNLYQQSTEKLTITMSRCQKQSGGRTVECLPLPLL